MKGGWLGGAALVALIALGCGKDRPVPFRDERLGIAIVFPGAPQGVRYAESTPFGAIEWFGRAYRPAGRLDSNFQAEVGNLPPGSRGGTTPAEVMGTYHRWLIARFGRVERTELSAEQGPGFRYRVRSPMGTYLNGALVVRRGRLHRAEATTSQGDEPKARTFLEDFEVLP